MLSIHSLLWEDEFGEAFLFCPGAKFLQSHRVLGVWSQWHSGKSWDATLTGGRADRKCFWKRQSNSTAPLEQRQILPRRAQHKAVLFVTAPAIPGAVNSWNLGFVPAALIGKQFHGEEAKRGDPAGLGPLGGGAGYLQTDWLWMKCIIPSHLA